MSASAAAIEAGERRRRATGRETIRGDAVACGVPSHHAGHEYTAAPEDEAGVVARGAHPARLVQHGDASGPPDDAVELRRVADLGKEPEEVAGIVRREARPRRVEPAAASGREPDRAE